MNTAPPRAARSSRSDLPRGDYFIGLLTLASTIVAGCLTAACTVVLDARLAHAAAALWVIALGGLALLIVRADRPERGQ